MARIAIGETGRPAALNQPGLVKRIRTSHNLRKMSGLANQLLISAIGVRLTSARTSGLEKEWFDRLLYFNRLMDLVKDVDGDVVECGVHLGRGLAIFTNLVRSSGKSRHLWGFDSWEGFPAPSKEDFTSSKPLAEQGGFSGAGIEHVRATLRWHGLSDAEIARQVTLIKGFFSDTLPHYRGGPIALLHVDGDLYQSYRDTLENLWAKVAVGGVAAFDEYHEAEDWPGAKRAVDEFLGSLEPGTSSLHKDELTGQYYALKTG